MNKNINENKKKEPYLPIDGSEDAHPLLIPLHDFELNHHTFTDGKKDEDKNKERNKERNKEENKVDSSFIGRDNLIDQLESLLDQTSKKRGSYLIAGYRGSGKTSLINRVVKTYKDNKDNKANKVIVAPINLGHDAVLDTRHVLFNIISVLKHEFNRCYQEEKNNWLNPVLLSFLLLGVIAYLTGFHNADDCYSDLIDRLFKSWSNFDYLKIKDINLISLPVNILLIFIILSAWLIPSKFRGRVMAWIYLGAPSKKNKNKYYLVKKINNLHDKVAFSFEKDFAAGVLTKRFPGFGFKQRTNMPEMKEPQIELELIDFLKYCPEMGFNIVFIFDELDKISLTVTESSAIQNIPKAPSTDTFENETIDENIYRRKKCVDSLLASLKSLITVGQARFFFIAGRDMLDSYQSEKGSTSSLYESLFDQVFEVPSFLTDDSDQRKTHLHSMIEVYVCSRLLKNDMAERYWLANQLCGRVVNDYEFKEIVSENFKSLLATEVEPGDLSGLIIERLLSTLTKIDGCNWDKLHDLNLSIDHENALKKFKKIHKNEIDDFDEKIDVFKSSIEDKKNYDFYNKLFLHVVYFLRAVFISCLSVPKIKEIIEESDFIKSQRITDINYSIPRLNVYYLYLLHNLESENDAKMVVNTLHQFINYLTIHSWGNCKRLSSLFESFIKPHSILKSVPNAMNWLPVLSEDNYMLHFGVTERQRISMGSNLYIMFNHHLSRQFTGADKLVVSTMAALHYCLKFHRSAFSRHHLFRMTEMMSIYSSPELNSIFETTLTQVIWPYIRVIRNGMPQYRFFAWIEQEIRYIARVNDLESASYTFSLDAINNIKTHYRKTLENVMSTYKTIESSSEERGPGLIAEINIVLGDIYLLERAYDESVVYYQTAVNAHHSLKGKEHYHLECLLRYVEALLKLGNVQEHRQRYDRAAMNYYQAMQLVNEFLEQQGKGKSFFLSVVKQDDSGLGINDLLMDGDSKWVLLKQPYWALLYLNLKRGHGDRITTKAPDNLYGDKGPNNKDPYGEYRRGQLCFYLGRHNEATEAFTKVIHFFPKHSDLDQYYSFYLIPTACINLAENELVRGMSELPKQFESQGYKKRDEYKSVLIDKSITFIKTMGDVPDFHELQEFNFSILKGKSVEFDMKKILQLIFYAAKQYERNKLYDHAAMAYLKAISLWAATIDMLPLNYIDSNDKKKIKDIIENMDYWFTEASEKALQIIMDSNGQAQQQTREAWHFRDIADYPHKEDFFDTDEMGSKKIKNIHSQGGRKKLVEDIAFWQGSYLGQQLIMLQNWVFTIRRTLSEQAPDPLKSYRMPLYTTRSLILSSWLNGRERLSQAREIRVAIKNKVDLREEVHGGGNSKVARDIFKDLKDKQKKFIDLSSGLEVIDCYYIISAKGIHNFYSALQYMRVLTDNNQAIIIPPPAFVTLHLWRLLYRLVEYEVEKSETPNICDICCSGGGNPGECKKCKEINEKK